ncbi:MAG TPA: redoxin domain-containing protein [Solirubrobacteraceae bacterium]|nr:redoxin domain-containing protein [Solirubrobacteraceae bacterium]
MTVLPAGSEVPEFTLKTEDGEPFTRDDLAGKTTVLVFFPAAFSSVCTDQFQIYEEVLEDFAAQGATLYGVSIDQTDSQVAFRESVGTTITMLSDAVPQAAATKAFGAFFAPTGVANRALVIVGPDLTVRWAWEGEHPGILPGANLIFDGLAARTA